MVDKNVVEDFLRAIQPQQSNTDHTYSATVTRIDETGIVWVQLAGSDKETPTASTSSEVKMGDEVNVQWRNYKLYIAGNYSNPSAGSVRVNAVEVAAQVANQAATQAVEDADTAKQAAEDAQTAATQAEANATTAKRAANNASEYAARALGNLSTVQSVVETLTWITQHGTMTLTSDVALDPTHVYFVQDAGGDYVVGGTHYSVVTEPDVADIGTYYELTIDESLNNYVGTHLALTSEGLWLIPEVGGNKVLIATGGQGHTYEDAGTYIIDGNNNVLAQFLSSGVIIGQKAGGKTRAEITQNGLKVVKKPPSGADQELAYMGYDTNDNLYYTFGLRQTGSSIGHESVAEGSLTTASGFASHAEGSSTEAADAYAHAEGAQTTAGYGAHAEGVGTSATDRGHSEGMSTTASGTAAHAEGISTTASGRFSHSQNQSTIAGYGAQTVIGKFNDNKSANAFEIGNGTADNARSNALTVDWGGNICLALDTTAQSGIDHDLYSAITALGWQSDVIV